MKWALRPHGQTADVIKDLHIVIESLRNSFMLVHSRIGAWLAKTVSFDEREHDSDDINSFWSAVGVSGEWLEVVVDLNPWFADGRLWVAAKWNGHGKLDENLSRSLLYLFKFRQYTDSRWCTIGASCRVLVSCLAVGLESLIAFVRDDPGASDFYLHGFGRLTPEIKQYAVLASMVAYVPDSFLVEVMVDDRIGKRLSHLKTTMAEELSWLYSVNEFTWKRLTHLVAGDLEHTRLRSEALRSGATEYSFVTHKVLSVAEGLPWSLALGDVDLSLNELLASDVNPTDDTAQKVKHLLHAGCGMGAPFNFCLGGPGL